MQKKTAMILKKHIRLFSKSWPYFYIHKPLINNTLIIHTCKKEEHSAHFARFSGKNVIVFFITRPSVPSVPAVLPFIPVFLFRLTNNKIGSVR